MILHGVDLARYRKGDVVQFRPYQRVERCYSSYLRPESYTDRLINFVVGIHTPEWLEAEMRRRVYQPMIQTRGFDPARLPA